MNSTIKVIAEAGINHNGNFKKAIKLVKIAKMADADYVKFQLFKTENFINKEIKHNDISQCFVQEYISLTPSNVSVGTFRVVALMLNGTEVVIIKNLHNYRDARIFEQWVESRLSIEDKSVQGEVAL